MITRIIATLLLGFAISAPLAEGSEHNEQVIPPTVYEQQGNSTVSDPILMEDIVITHRTPADEFANAITPLVLTLGFGSIGLVVYTLVNKEKQRGLPD
ncbi:hypothetical protein [Candidatus Aquiluna sp. UB-MaderosW2red]|uniref:hypothetical protein n=1 Tax=Candidatus Aquiluna sp. UB-MaderosW2red TaxID=1855377 RepID=UPI000875AAC5|nr:hypothetical protein [Candidatus Aquiluna sp. UB-MaderosW2red]SCX02409.1 hypothetical protein SAMN05216534_0009 [Candidatus Aquiluna sp. UB-MaderosW2red]